MKVNWPLLLWLFRPLRGLTAAGAVVATAYTLFVAQPLDFLRDNYAILFVLVHSLLISRLVVRVHSPPFAFLYSQGFSRDALWGHVWMASALSVLGVCLPGAVAILFSLRSRLQDLMLNPWYPLLAPDDGRFLAWGLLTYAIVLPVFHYEWIRSAAPFRGLVAGNMLALGLITFGLLLAEPLSRVGSNPVGRWMIGGFTVSSVLLGIAGRWVHRRIEVCA